MKNTTTGRDTFIVCKALAYAILTIQSLPKEWQELSDCQDMKLLLDRYSGRNQVVYDNHLEEARWHMEHCPNRVVVPFKKM